MFLKNKSKNTFGVVFLECSDNAWDIMEKACLFFIKHVFFLNYHAEIK